MELSNGTDLCANFVFGKSSVLQLLDCTPLAPYLPLILLTVFTSILFYVLALTADKYLCPALVELSKLLGLSESLAGVTLVAFGNGAPDVFSALSGIRQNKSSMVFSQLFGSGAFVSALVAGIVMIVVPPFDVDWPSFSRDMIFYMSGSIFTFYVFYRSKIHLMHAVAFVAIYVIYIAAVGLFSSYWQSEQTLELDEEAMSDHSSLYGSMKSVFDSALSVVRATKSNNLTDPVVLTSSYGTFDQSGSTLFDSGRFTEDTSSHFIFAELVLHTLPWTWDKLRGMPWYSQAKSILLLPVNLLLSLTIPVVDRDVFKSNWCKTLNTVHCVLTPAFTVFLFSGDFDVYGVPLSLCVLPVSLTLGALVFCTSRINEAPKYHVAFALMGFAASVAWIFRTCEILVCTLSAIGTVMGIPDSIMGLTVLSWGSSLGDLVTNIAIAKHGYASMAISAAFGGILLDMLLGLGIPYAILVLSTEEWVMELEWTYAVVPLFAGVVSFILVASAGLYSNQWRTSKLQGCVFISIYAITVTVSVAISIAESLGGFT
ncbi:putative sodium/calcium exchanger 7 [Galendromus occidentalis]|uniref:Sodium/calcium exchanger 7 n=1 Tax=Galendromus occidentalis TaxID=34638 RepID=A0AAJ6QXU9_9ACAR|nr:putative sodium/calcium exchanger 7 [Galendromus occidentalis]